MRGTAEIEVLQRADSDQLASLSIINSTFSQRIKELVAMGKTKQNITKDIVFDCYRTQKLTR